MLYNFEPVNSRKNTNSIKHDFHIALNRPADAIPLWVADMDFLVPVEVEEALLQTTKHGIYGYTDTGDDYLIALREWFAEGFDFHFEDRWLVKTPGVVFAICMAIQALTNEGDAILIQQPVYHPFLNSILDNKRKPVDNSLVLQNGKYQVDITDFENKIVTNDVKMFILCSPHNPVGRVWTPAVLKQIGDICL